MLILLFTAGPVLAQDTCGKLYESQDCGPAAYEEALARQKEQQAAKQNPPLPPEQPPETGENQDLRQRALDLYRARAAAMGGAFQCCHFGPGGQRWCH